MRVAWFPKTEDLEENPYWPLLQRNLEAQSVTFETSHSSYWMTFRWLWRFRKRVNVLHFHFVQPQYAGPRGRVSPKRLWKLAAYLILARLWGYRVVWTMHDLMPVWPMAPEWMERLGRYVIAWLANDIIVHCEQARRLLAVQFRRARRVRVLPLPGYVSAHPNTVSRSAARERLGIDSASFVVAFIGGIRPNKGLEHLIQSFGTVCGTDAVLLVAGKAWHPKSYVQEIQRLAACDRRIVLRAEAVPDDELQLYINAADVLAFPFVRVLTSSSVMLAMSFGRPVVVPRLGCLPELVGIDGGIVYDPGDPQGLSDALALSMTLDLDEMGAAAMRRANATSWRDLAYETAKVYANSQDRAVS